MPDREKVIADIEEQIAWIQDNDFHKFPGWGHAVLAMKDAIALLKEQETVEYALEVLRKAGWKETHDVPFPVELLKEQEAVESNMLDCFEPWDVLWKAPDGTFKGRCDNCGFVHVFIESHVTQYKFCPQCGEQKQEL